MGWDAADLKLFLEELKGEAKKDSVIKEKTFGNWTMRMLLVPPGQSYSGMMEKDSLFLCLEGLGSLRVGEWRATVFPGQFVDIPAGKALIAVGDHDSTLAGVFLTGRN